MTEDYYSPHPRLVLERPMLIAGEIGCGARMVGRTPAARTGLPFVEVDRRIEHEVGTSVADLVARTSVDAVSRRARNVLEACALQRPAGVIVLDAAWPNLEVRSLIGRRMEFVYLERSASYLLARIEKEVHRGGRWLLRDQPFRFRSPDDLAPLRAARSELLSSATVRYDAADQHAHEIVDGLLECLEAVFGAHAL